MKTLLIVGGLLIAGYVIATKLRARTGMQPASSTVPMSLSNFTSAVAESSSISLPAVEGPGNGAFTGSSTDTRAPLNAIVLPGATTIRNNPVLEWVGTAPSKQINPIVDGASVWSGRRLAMY